MKFYKFFFPGKGIVLEQSSFLDVNSEGYQVVEFQIHTFRALLRLNNPLGLIYNIMMRRAHLTVGTLKVTPEMFMPQVGLSIAFIQAPAGGTNPGSVTTTNLAFASNVAAGNFIAVAHRYAANGRTVTVSDTRSSTYLLARLHIQTNDGSGEGSIRYAENIPTAGSCTVTMAISGLASTTRGAIAEFSGVRSFNSLDQVNSAEGSSTALASGNITPVMSGELILCFGFVASGTTFTNGTDFSKITNVPDTASGRLGFEYYIQPAAAAHNGTFTVSSQAWSGIIASFFPQTSLVNPKQAVNRAATY